MSYHYTNAHARSAAKILRRLTDPNAKLSERALANGAVEFTRHVIDAAIKEIRKEMQDERVSQPHYINEAILHEVNIVGGDKDTAAEIVAKQLEEDGAKLPQASYEGAGDPPPPPHHYKDYRKGGNK